MRCVHLAPQQRQRCIERAGLRGSPVRLATHEGETLDIPRGVYCMPVLANFSTTFQWMREMRRWHGQRLVAVYLSIPDDLPVWVGRYDQPHYPMAVREACRWVVEQPQGAQILIPRSVTPAEIDKVWEMTQRVGWTEIPEADRKTSCVCIACLPPGLPDLLHRLRGAYREAVTELRRATNVQEAAAALEQMQIPLERARGRLSPRRILSQARSPHPAIRRVLADLLAMFRWPEVESTLSSLLNDPEELVSQGAVSAIWNLLGSGAALDYLWRHQALVYLVAELEWERNEATRAAALDRLSASPIPGVAEAVARLAARLRAEEAEFTHVDSRGATS